MIDNTSELNEIIKSIQKTDSEIQSEVYKDDDKIDKKKIFKLRYRQMIQGLYLNQYGTMNNR